MSAPEKDYRSTIMRMAGNIAAGMMPAMRHEFANADMFNRPYEPLVRDLATLSVSVALAIVGETLRSMDDTTPAEIQLGAAHYAAAQVKVQP